MIGLRLNNYELVSLLGEGGMGMVYLARHSYMGRKAAVKILRPELLHDKPLVARFMEEARATNAIKHPNIIDIIDVGMLPETQTPYLMMELLEGESLANRLRGNRKLPAEEAIEIACQTASALAAAHACQIIHRDLKPDNLFLVPDKMLACQVRVKVLDFGIAKLKGDLRARSAQTKSGILMGTPFYMSPEQCRGTASGVDARSDIYSLGVIVYEMVCGQVPFVSDGVGDLLVRHITEPPQRPSQINPAVPPELERVILRALAKNPADRYESMTAFEQALRECQSRRDSHGEVVLASEMQTLAAAEIMRPSPPNPGSQTTLSSTIGEVEGEKSKRKAGRLRRKVLLPTAGVVLIGTIALSLLGSKQKSTPEEKPASQLLQPHSPPPEKMPTPESPYPPPVMPVVSPEGETKTTPQSAASAAEKVDEGKERPRKARSAQVRNPPSPSRPHAASSTVDPGSAPTKANSTPTAPQVPPASSPQTAPPSSNPWGRRRL